uniref:Uncharacterized protein n=1 Tax=Parascaris equorum TaxID=6256 RepID=A0A914S543_PAREQ
MANTGDTVNKMTHIAHELAETVLLYWFVKHLREEKNKRGQRLGMNNTIKKATECTTSARKNEQSLQAIGIAAVIVPITLTLITKADFDVQSDDAANDYAEVRVLLNEYYKLIGRKYSSSNDYNAKEVNVALQNSSFDDGTEASTNRKGGVAGELFENDILLTLPQAQRLLKEASG